MIAAQITVRRVSFSAVFDAPNSAEILRSYAEECLVSGTQPQRAMYDAMERSGVLVCFAAYTEDTLIGFVSVLVAVMPHTGSRMATVESMFVDPEYRSTGAGNDLLFAAEQYAREAGCQAISCVARVESAFDKVLARRTGYTLTHTQHTRWLP